MNFLGFFHMTVVRSALAGFHHSCSALAAFDGMFRLVVLYGGCLMCFSGGVLLQVATGEKIAAFALTEPSSGSDAMVSW